MPVHAELRPRDFAARLGRRAPGIGARQRRQHVGKRAAVLLAAVAFPAIAAPGEWTNFAIGNAGRAEVQLEPMPFERTGDSFPGSAFYYLAPDEPTRPLDTGAQWDYENGQTPVDPFGGPTARSMRVTGSEMDRQRALTCLTQAIYYEAASEPDAGQRAVAQVVLNRVAHPSYPNTVCGVVFQGSERTTGCQFSFTCDGALNRVPHRMFWLRAESVARAALSGYVYAPVGLATHYHTIAVNPYWAPKLHYLGTIGAHRFYKFNGPAGTPGAFRTAYVGGEPLPAPNPRSSIPASKADPAVDPLLIQKAYEQGLKNAQTSVVPTAQGGLAPARPAPAPSYAPEVQARGGDRLYRGEKLPDSQGIRPEYQNSGQWIAQPGT
ncbi:cell wall hydrolase [Novosphingobium sp. TH158]|nr:cell wall hydrolase [Novosphingobium sp. TH158]